MSFVAKLQRAREVLEQQRRLSVRALGRELGLGGDELDEILEELVDVQQVASRDGAVLQWVGTQTADEGAGTGPTPTLSGARKVVTVVFADLAGSTALHERVDPESARRLMESYYAALRAAVERHGGTVVKLLGDGVLAAFGVPQVAEDDAMRAVHAGVAMQDAFGALVAGQSTVLGTVGLRVAINTGEVVVSGANDDVVGDPVNVAARLQQEARDGDVVLGEPTRRLVDALVSLDPLGSFALRGRAEAVKAYRVRSLEPPAKATAAAFVGRDEELARITAVYDDAVRTAVARLVVLLGSPGLGKSRLIDEFSRRTGESATVVAARCDAAGGATFAPLVEAFRELLGVAGGASADAARATIEAALGDEEDAPRIAAGIAALLSGAPASPEETFFVVRRLLAGIAVDKPVVLVIDDLQWAEPLLLDLVEHLVQWGAGVRLLVLIGARPELRDVRSLLVTAGGLVRDVVTLAGLDAGAATRLAANAIGAADLPASVAAKVLATSEGNPLFIGELVRMLVEEGALTRDGDRWTIGSALATLEMPPTIHALLAARIERLEPEERTVLERAAVVGRHFSRGAVTALLTDAGAGLDARLESLQRAELIERDGGWFLGEPALRFHHVLIRDAAYRRLLKRTRAELHERLAGWIEARVDEGKEHDETIGRHLEEAHRLLGELGPIDAAGQRLGERAATRLAAAGRRALEGDDVSLAASLLGRALDRLTAEDPARADLALDWCEALLAAGDVTGSAAAIDELGRLVDDSDRLRAWHTCFTGHHTVLTAPQELSATVEAVATATTSLASLDDAAGEAKGHFVQALGLARLGKVGPCEASLDQALAAARRAGDRRRANNVLAIAPVAALWGPSAVTRASGRCLDVVRVLRITQGAPAVEAVALSCQGVLEALRGRTEAAHRMIESGRQMVEELGIAQRLFETDVFAGFVAMLEGDAPKAERILRAAYDGLRELGLGIDAARAAALLGRALLAQGRNDEAEALSHESETLAGDDLKAAIAWRGVRAEALARRGEHAEATQLAQAGVEIAATTDALLDHADARLALAAALRAAGRHAEADAEDWRATQLWEAKGATLLAERVRRGGIPAAAPVAAPAPAAAHARRRRPVSHNFAIEEAQRVEAAVAARDVQALADVYRPDVQIVDHMHGLEYGYGEIVERVRAQIDESTDGAFRHETLATLGDFVALFRMDATATASVMHGIPLGETSVAYLLVIEADEHGCARRIDIFGEDALTSAIVRLYECHASSLPEGARRSRADGIARTLWALRTPFDPDVLAPVLDPGVQTVDHRTLGTWSAQGAHAVLEQIRGLGDVSLGAVVLDEDVLALGPDALLARRLHSGTERVGGGVYERQFLLLITCGADGRLNRWEFFDVGDEAQALARFDALTGSTPARAPVRRRLRPNASTHVALGIEAGFAARDASAIAALLADPMHTVEHPTGATYGREGQIETIARMLRLPNLEFRMEPLATLGEALCLVRRCVAASGTAGGRFDVAEFEMDNIALQEVGGDGRACRFEVFAADRLGDAIARLYERYAELLPVGPERDRAVAAAATRARVDGHLATKDPRGFVALLAPDFEGVDHRQLGSWSMRGAEGYLEHLLALHDVGEEMTFRPLDVLALDPRATLLRTMHSGVDRRGGGVYERPFLVIWMTGADGRFVRAEWFDDGCEAEALARFDELTVESSDRHPGRPPSRRAMRANAATEVLARMERAAAARDFVALRAALSDDYRELDHPTGSSFGANEAVASVERLFRSRDPYFRYDAVATLGPSLYLGWRRAGASGATGRRFDVGAYENAALQLYEADDRGLMRGSEAFAVDRLGESIVRLYELYAAQQPEDPARTRAAAIARSIAALDGPIDLDRVAPVYDPASRNVDHRVFGTWTTSNAVELLEHYRHQLELAPDFAARFEDVLALGPDGLLARMSFFGTGRDSGGAFENRLLVLFSFGADGRLRDTETFEPEQAIEALARFDALSGHAEVEPFDNAASRADREFVRRFNARDWVGIEALAAPPLVFDERRRMLHNTCDRAIWLEQLRVMFDVPASRFTTKLRATRGERLALSLHGFVGEVPGGGGPLAMDDHLVLHEVDRDGRIVAIVLFDLDAENAAHVELDRRFESGEGATFSRVLPSLRRGRLIRARDWQAWAAGLAPDFTYRDHRRLGFGNTVADAGALLHLLRSTVELAPDADYRDDHVRISPRGILRQTALVGSRDGGAFENPMFLVFEVDEQGRFRRADSYDLEDRDRALARFSELEARAAPRRFANAATRAVDRGTAALAARDWNAFGTLMAPGFRHYDRTRIAQLESDGEEWLVAFRRMVEMTTVPPEYRLLATRGDRLALFEMLWRGAGGDVGPSEIEWRLIVEVNERGEHEAIVVYDPGDLDAAYSELDARYEAEQGDRLPASWTVLRRWTRAVADRDWEAVASLCTDDFVEHDHRSLSLLGVTHGVEAWLQVIRTVSDLAPDSRFRINHFIPGARGYYEEGGFCGTREGGPFEIVLNALVEISDDGLLARVDIYDDDRVFTSPRWAELGIPVPSTARESTVHDDRGPTVIEPNAASAWLHRFREAFNARDWDALSALFAPDGTYEDRQRFARVSGGPEMGLSSIRARVEAGFHVERVDLLGTAGDRIAIQRMLWASGSGAGRSEVEILVVQEVDDSGRLVASINFDPGDTRSAQLEAWARWAAIEPEIGETVAVVSGLADAFNAHDRGRARALCDDALVYHDRRRTGVGRIDGADAAIASIEAYWKLAGDQQLELGWYWPACGRRGGVTVVRRFGTLPDGGAFESEYLELFGVRDGRATHLELFELEDLASALARFTELTAEASGDPLAGVAARPNPAVDRWLATYRTGFETGNWEPMREVCAPGFAYADRRRMVLVEGDVELLLASVRERAATGARVEPTPVGNAGDRVDIQRVLWSGGPAGGRFEIEYLAVTELDASGLITAFVLFDLDDAREAQREAWARWAAIEPHVAAVVAPVGVGIDAFNEKSTAKWRAAITHDVVVEDHRLAGIGRVEGADAYAESAVALWTLAPDSRADGGWRWLALDRYGGITIVRRTGTVPGGGGEFETEHLYLFVVDKGRISRIEMFEMNALEKALARFEELRPDPLRIPPNAAMRAVARWTEAMFTGDADAVRALLDESYVLDDRRRMIRTTTDRNAEITGHLPLIHEGGWHATTKALATAGDRLVLQSWLWTTGEGDARSEIEILELDELGDSGRFVRSVIFDPEDRAAAFEELSGRYVALGADGMAHGFFETMRGWNAHDLTRVRCGLTDDFVVEDHRLAGMGRLEGADAYVESVTALFELIPDAQTEFVYHVAIESHGRVSVNRNWGSNTEGGEVESFFVLLSLYRDDKVSKFELFDVEHLDKAVTRLGELRS